MLEDPILNGTDDISDETLDDPNLEESDSNAVWDSINTGKPLDPAIHARVRARSLLALERNFQRVGYVNIEELMNKYPDDDE